MKIVDICNNDIVLRGVSYLGVHKCDFILTAVEMYHLFLSNQKQL